MSEQDKRKTSGHSASMIDLKAELFRKQEDVKRLKLTNVSYMKGRPASSDIKKKNIWSKHNVGVVARSERDLEQKMEEEDSLEKSKRMLEKKAKLYDEMTNSEVIPDEDGSRVYLVDFQKKVIDKVVEKREEERRRDEEKEDSDISESTDSLEQWVDYTDNLGRSRRCLRKDLPHFIERETPTRLDSGNNSATEKATLSSHDMQRELQRQKWEQEAEEELNKPVGPIHYANVQHNEVRAHGVGFYQFSKDEDMRKQQLEMLKTMREQTVDQRIKRGKMKDKRKIQLDARLAKVRQRRQQREGGDILPAVSAGGDEDDLETMQEQDGVEEDVTTVTDTNTGQTVEEKSEVCDEKPIEKIPAKVREWDKGKRPEMFETFERRRTRLEEERVDEFAPPSFYHKGGQRVNTPRTVCNKSQSVPSSSLHETTIDKGRNDPPCDLIANTRKNLAKMHSVETVKPKNDILNEIPLPSQESSSNDIDLFLRSCKGVVSKETNSMATGDMRLTSNSLIGQTPDSEEHGHSTLSVVFDPTKPPPSFQTTVQAQMTAKFYPYVQENDALYSQTNLTVEKSNFGYTNPTFNYANQPSHINFPQNQPQTQEHANFIQYTNQSMENTNALIQQYNPNLYNYPSQPIRMPTSNLNQSLPATTAMTNPIDKLLDTNSVINPTILTTSTAEQTTTANVVDMRHVQSENPRKISTAAMKPRDMFSSLYGICDEDLSD